MSDPIKRIPPSEQPPSAEPTHAESKALRAECKQLRKDLRMLVSSCEQVIDALDTEMKKPSSLERGKRIAKMCNFLTFQKDSAKHFGLGLPLNKNIPLKKSSS